MWSSGDSCRHVPHYKTNSRIISRIIRLELVVDYQPDYQLNYQPDYQPGAGSWSISLILVELSA